MNWAIVSSGLVLACVVLGLAWFEAARPDPRQVATIAALAALAVAGRIAFAPIPNVKPTTDIVLLAGFAFGAVPGFVVGAVTALVSNMAFGQGLHTPWQMLAWGMVGLLGAGLARLTGRRPGRWGLAVAGAVAATGFSLFMDLSVWAQTAPTHSLAEYVVVAGRGAPFTAAHAVGSALFALTFGPAMVSSLTRARERAAARWDAPVPAADG